MRKFFFLFLHFFVLCNLSAQEYAMRECIMPEAANNTLVANNPIDVTKELSETTFKSNQHQMIFSGDLVAGISFKGYNPGKELMRHVRVWMWYQGREYEVPLDLIFDGDCIIPGGGNENELITLLNLEFPTPLKASDGWFRIKIECTGEVADEPLYFEHSDFYSFPLPVVTMKVLSEIKYLTGVVSDQDGQPVPGAEVSASVEVIGSGLLFGDKAVTNSEGRYSLRIEESNICYPITVTASGYSIYSGIDYRRGTEGCVDLSEAETVTERNITLFDKVSYTKGQYATIILPVAPDLSWGEYFRLARRDTTNIIFELVENPQANVPYVIFPSQDFELNISDYDLDLEPGKVELPFNDGIARSFQYASFYGSYKNQNLPVGLVSPEKYRLIDITPDCLSENPSYFSAGRIGACRAYLKFACMWPAETLGMIFEGASSSEPMNIVSAVATADTADPVFDLQGRRVTGQPRRGVYIQDGRKRVR